jgi:hypothetical protein
VSAHRARRCRRQCPAPLALLPAGQPLRQRAPPTGCVAAPRRPQQQALRALVSEKLALESAREVVRAWLGLLAGGCPPADVYQFSQLGDGAAAEFYDFSEGEGEEDDW